MSDTLDSLYWRYAVKKFDPDKELSNEKLELLKEAFNLTATSYGLQPIRMLVLRNKELQESLVAHSYGQRQVGDASYVLIICIEADIDSKYIEDYFKMIRKIRGTSEEILKPFQDQLIKSFQDKTIEEIQKWAKNQAYLALGNLLTVCAVERIDSCPMEGFNPEAYIQVLGLSEKGLLPVIVLPVGYRSGDDFFSDFKKVRRSLNDTVLTISDEQPK